MREIRVGKNDSNQRLDRFLKKYMDEAGTGFIYKMLRKKNIKVNESKASPEMMIFEGDTIQLYLSDETIDKFIGTKEVRKSKLAPRIIYEDENLVLINKPAGILSHGAGEEFEENIVDSLITYLIQKGDYIPRIEKTFSPSICNRLDRNTSGVIIGAKNSEALRLVNKAIKEGSVRKYYKTIVKGTIKEDFEHKGFLIKDEDRNLVDISDKQGERSKDVYTKFRVIMSKGGYSLLEVELITGRTHQIRSTLQTMGYPVIGDRKYGNSVVNDEFRKKYGLENQWLHGYRIVLNGLEEKLDYLNSREFIAEPDQLYVKIEQELFR
ncbi:RluA family pseudouridine synthase [Gudongella oleilytica]|uniref:RluA family pseudouridine synthase n=1 Tax=Gudongella oleilytica TaxID=1582259 RepID=UPI000FF8AFA1|nr:RluA family pseudouridine synthase [Gudongella oleilytica]MDY0257038.1 RluA family pseudouridine synthase [Gudongella oleilytica]